MSKHQERDLRYLAAIEEITQTLWKCKEKYNLQAEETPLNAQIENLGRKANYRKKIN